MSLSFGTAPNTMMNYITFDIVDMVYPIVPFSIEVLSINLKSQSMISTCMKIPNHDGPIIVYGDQQVPHNIKRDFVSRQQNMHCLAKESEDEPHPRSPTTKKKEAFQNKWRMQKGPFWPHNTKPDGVNKRRPNQSKRKLVVGLLSRNKYVFAWSSLDLVGVRHNNIEHILSVNPLIWPKKWRLHIKSDEKTKAVKVKVRWLLDTKFIEPIGYQTWLTNVVMASGECT